MDPLWECWTICEIADAFALALPPVAPPDGFPDASRGKTESVGEFKCVRIDELSDAADDGGMALRW